MDKEEKLAAITEAVAERMPDGQPYAARTSAGPVLLARVEVSSNGQPCVEVTVGEPEGGDPRFRVFNPPMLVADPRGDVTVNGHRYRQDPLGALAEVIAGAGGVRRQKGRR